MGLNQNKAAMSGMASGPEGEKELESIAVLIRSSLAILWRRKRMIILVVILSWLGTRLALSLATPTYSADALLMIDERQTRVIQIGDVLSDVRPTRTSLLGEVEVLRSRELAKRVMAELELDKNPTFNPVVVSRWAWLSDLLPESGPDGSRTLSAEELRAREEARLLKRFLAKLTVKQITLSPVIRVSFEASDPKLAAAIANAVADQYLNGQLTAKFEAARRATAWLSERLTDLRDKMTSSERSVADYRERHRIVDVRAGASLGAETVSNLNTQYLTAQAKRAETEARYELVRRVLAGHGALNASGDIAGSPQAQQLREQETAASRKLAELSARYGDRHPAIIDAKGQLDDVRGKLAAEIRRIAEALKNELDISRIREDSLHTSLQQAQAQIQEAEGARVGLHDLEREAEASKLIYETFLKRFKETSEQQTLQQSQASTLSYAVPPITASSPRKSLIMLLTLVGSLGLAVGLALLLEALDTLLRSAEQVEAATGLPVLGMMPRLRPVSLGAVPPDAGQAIRTLRGGLRLLGGKERGQVLCLTSLKTGDGKTMLAAWLGLHAAAQGERVLLIDCDPHPSLGLDRLPSSETVHVVAAAKSGAALESQISQARAAYDLVVLDTPSLLTAADARFLAPLADATLLVLRWNSVRAEEVRWPLRQLRSATSHDMGVVIAQVDVRDHARHGYRDAGYYLGRA